MRRPATVVVTATLLFAPLGLRAVPSRHHADSAPQQATPGTFAPIETIRVGVFDESGAPITGLSAADFVLREDGEVREIVAVESVVDASVDVVLVLDQSYSMYPARWQQHAVDFLHTLSPQRDCVLLVRFGRELRTSSWRRPDDPTLIATIEESRETGGTALFDALAEAMRQLFAPGSDVGIEAPAESGQADARAASAAGCLASGIGSPADSSRTRRMAIVAVTDGQETFSRQQEEDSLKMAVQAVRAPIFHIEVVLASPTREFRRLTIASGGETFEARSDPFEQLENRLRYYYTVRYRIPRSPGTVGRFEFLRHEIDVGIPGRHATLLHRPLVYRPALDAEVANAHLDEAIRLYDSQQNAVALDALDRSIAANPFIPETYAYRARILASTNRVTDALETALRATELEPANAEYHRLVSDVARDAGDDVLAWSHAVRAVQTGEATTEILDTLATTSAPPGSLPEQLAAPRLVVLPTPPEQPDLIVRAALPGAIRSIQRSASRDPGVGLVADPLLSQCVVWVGEKELSEGRPRRFKGRLRLTDRAGDELYDEDFTLENIDDPAASARDLARHIAEIVERCRRRAR